MKSGSALKIMYVCSDVLVIYLVMKNKNTLISLFHLVRLRLSPFQTQLLQYHHHVFDVTSQMPQLQF